MRMHHTIRKSLAPAILLTLVGWTTSPTLGQTPDAAPANSDSASADAQEAARRRILDSDRWRQTQRELHEWLSVQTIYSPEEVAAIKANLRDSMANKSSRELEDLMKDMESRLKVLTSPEAEDARQWLAQFMAVAVNPEQQLGRTRPDVLNMTASQIRQELQWLQQTREARLQSQAASDRGRAAQSQVARNARAARQQSRAPIQGRSSWPANNPRRPSQYAPQAELLPAPLSTYVVSPWGHPVHWHPMRGQW
jgi:hypothetical protein